MTINKIMEEICTPNSKWDEIINNILRKAKKEQHKDLLISELAYFWLRRPDRILQTWNEGWFKQYFISAVHTQVNSYNSSLNKYLKSDKKDIFSDLEFEIDNDYNTNFISINVDSDYIISKESDLKRKENLEKDLSIIITELKRIKNVTWFDETMFREYYLTEDSTMSYRKIADKYNINHTRVYKAVNKVVEQIQKQIQKNNN